MSAVRPIPYVVLVRPREEGNVGAAARAMANMGLERLVLVEPAPELGAAARAMGVGARHLLDRVERQPTLAAAIAGARRVVGTTSSRDRALDTLLSPRDLPRRLAADPAAHPTALVFGPEVGGLSNDELALCGVVVAIPAAPDHPTLNLAQAVLIVAYELYAAGAAGAAPQRERVAGASHPPAPADAIAGLVEQWRELLRAGGFARDPSFDGVARDLGALLARSSPNEREVRILRGVARRLTHRLKKTR